jgi:hypothetical protein
MNPEHLRLEQDRLQQANWRKWGPYLSERQWGTVREDYSTNGDAWSYLGHEAARSKAYRWGEDGLAGISDEDQILCLSLALWNGVDPILKERLFGLANGQGNHGEDVKELYYYLDATPTNSYLKMLYKYPQRQFPYQELIRRNAERGKADQEFELLDTGVFDDDRYFDVFMEYAKAGPCDILCEATIHNRGPEPAALHVAPQLWFRNTWSWKGNPEKPELTVAANGAIEARHAKLGVYFFYSEGEARLLFSDNETNVVRLYGQQNVHGFFKDAFHDMIVHGNHAAVNPEQQGTRAAVQHTATVPAQGVVRFRWRLREGDLKQPFDGFDKILDDRRKEADAFYAELQKDFKDDDARNVQRQAFAGLIWNKQFYDYDVPEWIKGDPAYPPPPPERRQGRNKDWMHLNNSDVISMPDKWEYPYYCVWDSAFHCVTFALIDPEYAKQQLVLLLREWYMHPNGQIPAYEWNFSDVNPPVHAWAALRVFQIDRRRSGQGDIVFLERVFHKLLLNFTWWVNRKDAAGRNLFQGGFLGLDNIGVFDRSAPLPEGVQLDQADGTSWMAMFSLNMMRIALELSLHNHVYEDIATKFFEHFLSIAEAMTNMAHEGIGLWDEIDEFYYDVLDLSDKRRLVLRVRSIVGLIPLFAVECLEPEVMKQLPDFSRRLRWFLRNRPDLARLVSRWEEPGRGNRRLLSLLRGHRMKCLLKRMLDETEFLSAHGVRSLSRYHRDHPYEFDCAGKQFRVSYVPGDSDSNLFGGNSNWRGPIWFPINFLLIESLQKFHHYYGDDFKVECPTGSGRFVTILQAAEELTRRLTCLFCRDEQGRRPAHGPRAKLQTDPHFRDYILFSEYFHGDDGRGLGSSHQTGWTALVAKLLQPRAASH